MEFFEERRRYVDQYLEEIRAAPIARKDEEKALLAAARGSDKLARKRVIESYLVLTAHLALRFSPADADGVDAIQEANIALIRLIENPAIPEVAGALPVAVHDAVRSFVEWLPPLPVGTRVRYIGPPLYKPIPQLPPLLPGEVGAVWGFEKDQMITVEWDQHFGLTSVPLGDLEILNGEATSA
ncbi:MAG: hypothetical protein ACRDHO_12900 [Actinomycetota bacterium]